MEILPHLFVPACTPGCTMEAGLDNWVDILVIALYFFFVMAVGVWVSDNCTVKVSFCLYIFSVYIDIITVQHYSSYFLRMYNIALMNKLVCFNAFSRFIIAYFSPCVEKKGIQRRVTFWRVAP